jgi:DUF1680 family protein
MPSPLSRRKFIHGSILAAGALRIPISTGQGSDAGNDATSLVHALMRPVDFSQVTITDSFWRPKQQKVATVTLSACIKQTEERSGRIRNFEKAARRQGEHEGMYYDDSDVYKALEAIAYSLKNRPDADLEKKADEWIDKIGAAQLPDGYLNTWFTLKGLDHRWTDMEKHEDYCAGHLIEAAVAYYRSTGKRKLLEVAIRFADHIDETFRVPNRHWVSGHEEIELALVKLYHLTDDDRYLKLAVWYLDQRGHGYGRGALWGAGDNPDYCQDSVPVKAQRQIVGHAVRAMYLYCGAADVAAATGDPRYMEAMRAVWNDVVLRKMYVTGGIGSSGLNEGFSVAYDLPNASAYCETCASVGMVLWNQRMAQLTGDGQYLDILERTLYNGAIDGLSLSGDRFFYGNPLASSSTYPHAEPLGRSEWFGTACCPSNISRLVASLGGYLYGVSGQNVWVNLFVGSSARLAVGGTDLGLRVETNYPWEGTVKLTVNPTKPTHFGLHLRIPGWARGVAVPGDLYRFAGADVSQVVVLLNGRPLQYREQQGYAVINRTWNRGDVIELTLPMRVQQLVSRDEISANRDRIALQRGPLVYCVEGSDNLGGVWNLIASRRASFADRPQRVLDEDIVALRGEGLAVEPTSDGTNLQTHSRIVTAIPYYTWANRENYEMQVWLPTRIDDVKING